MAIDRDSPTGGREYISCALWVSMGAARRQRLILCAGDFNHIIQNRTLWLQLYGCLQAGSDTPLFEVKLGESDLSLVCRSSKWSVGPLIAAVTSMLQQAVHHIRTYDPTAARRGSSIVHCDTHLLDGINGHRMSYRCIVSSTLVDAFYFTKGLLLMLTGRLR